MLRALDSCGAQGTHRVHVDGSDADDVDRYMRPTNHLGLDPADCSQSHHE